MSYKEERILVEDDNMIVGQLEPAASSTSFTQLEDWIVRSLDMLSPFDADFINNHMEKRSKAEIDERLNCMEFRVGAAEFKKVPTFTFELIFVRDRTVALKSLMLLTGKQLAPLRCRTRPCQHDFPIPRVQLTFSPKSPFGFEVGELCRFIAASAKTEHLPYLRRNVYTMEEFLTAARVDYRNISASGETGPSKVIVTLDSIKRAGGPVVRIDQEGRIIMSKDHEQTLHNIVRAVGKNKWEDTTQLLLAVHDSEIDFDAEDIEIFKRVAGYYRANLDTDMQEEEEQCVMYLYRAWHNTMQGDNLWNHIARHLVGRTAPAIRNRFLRVTQNSNDVNLDNMKRFPDKPDLPATFAFNNSHVISLIILPKSSSTIMDITTKLQHEVRFLVAGTHKKIFLLPCKYTAIRCTHMGMEQQKFTYDPEKPGHQFLTYLKLTFTNALKKAKLVEAEFEYTELEYGGEEIHEFMGRAERERFIVPKEEFMRLNRRQVASTLMTPTGVVGPRPAGPPIPVMVGPGLRGRPRGGPRGRPRKPGPGPAHTGERGRGRGRPRGSGAGMKRKLVESSGEEA